MIMSFYVFFLSVGKHCWKVLFVSQFYLQYISLRSPKKAIEWESPVGKGSLACRSKFLLCIEDSCEQHAPNLQKKDTRLSHLCRLSSAAIQSKLIVRISSTLNICFAWVRNNLNSWRALILFDCHQLMSIPLKQKDPKPTNYAIVSNFWLLKWDSIRLFIV